MAFRRGGYTEPNPYSHHSLSGKERANTERTLLCLLRGCQGYRTLVELRNESTVYGKLLNCDGFMNLIIADALFTKINGESKQFTEIHILGKNIRYVHIPDEIDIRTAIEQEISKIAKSRKTGSMAGRGRGRSRFRGRGGGGRGGRGGGRGTNDAPPAQAAAPS